LHWNVAPIGTPPAAVRVRAVLFVVVGAERDVRVDVVLSSWATPP